jgi:hypothetical protein
MRSFLQHHRELYNYQLTAHEVRDAVRAALDPEYNLEQCHNDLLALKEWSNVTTIYDSSRASSIAIFLSPSLLYQATPEAIASETFLEAQRERIARLFVSNRLNIDAMSSISTDDRAVLMEIIDACLGHPSCQYRTLDGSTITLLSPGEQVHTVLDADDGRLILPYYLLARQVPASLQVQEEVPQTQDSA